MNNNFKYKLLPLIFAFFAALSPLKAQNGTPDSVDVLHYSIKLDIGNRTEKRMEGSTEVRMVVLKQMDSIGLELCSSDIDSVLVNGRQSDYSFQSAFKLLKVPFSGLAGDTVDVTVFYRKGQHVMSQGWGGFYFDNNLYYNLGIAIYEYPHNVGKAWFPCRDNFTDKATYRFEITAKPGWKAICTGMLDTVVSHSDGSSTWCWDLRRQTPTYLVGVAVAPFHIIEREYECLYGTYPGMLGFLSHDSASVWNVFENMGKVLPMFERCFGPYLWDRVGYVSTTRGSMEHVGNVALATQCMASSEEACLATISHELSHSWFGNLLTCMTSEDMWINEGGASFCEEVAIQAIYADTRPQHYKDYANSNLKSVLLKTHETDGGFFPVYGPTHDITYGSTVYSKGATVWHSLRGYMGDSLFYSSLRTLFDHCAFQNIDSWQLRDSLSLYSGMDLTDFFDFHVFTAGFNDFVIDSMSVSRSSVALYLRQKNYGTDALANGNRVWVTFFSDRLQQARRLVTFDGETTRAVVPLSFTPAFAIVDFDGDLSKASIGQQKTIVQPGRYELEDAFFKVDANQVSDSSRVWLYVKHHWSRPDTSLSPQILQMADRFWTVTGLIPDNADLTGHFYFSRRGTDRTLDDDLLTDNSMVNSVRLLYRSDAGDQWRVVSSEYSGMGSQGYFLMPQMKRGEYTLAVVDTNYVGFEDVATTPQDVRVYPNPSTGRVTIATDRPGERLTVDVRDSGGRLIYNGIKVKSGANLDLELPSGNYLFTIHRKGCPDATVKLSVRR